MSCWIWSTTLLKPSSEQRLFNTSKALGIQGWGFKSPTPLQGGPYSKGEVTDRSVSAQLCGCFRRQGPRKVLWRNSELRKFSRGCWDGGMKPRCALGQPSPVPGVREEICSEELWGSHIFSYTKEEILAARPFLSSPWHSLIDDWKWWQYINYFSFYFMTW